MKRRENRHTRRSCTAWKEQAARTTLRTSANPRQRERERSQLQHEGGAHAVSSSGSERRLAPAVGQPAHSRRGTGANLTRRVVRFPALLLQCPRRRSRRWRTRAWTLGTGTTARTCSSRSTSAGRRRPTCRGSARTCATPTKSANTTSTSVSSPSLLPSFLPGLPLSHPSSPSFPPRRRVPVALVPARSIALFHGRPLSHPMPSYFRSARRPTQVPVTRQAAQGRTQDLADLTTTTRCRFFRAHATERTLFLSCFVLPNVCRASKQNTKEQSRTHARGGVRRAAPV